MKQNELKHPRFVDHKGKVHRKEYEKKKTKQRQMDFSKVKTLKIALKFSYVGKGYEGLVV